MTAKWKRDIEVITGPLTIRPRTAEGENQPILKMRFDITKTNNRAFNSAELAIWNLKLESRTLLQPKGLEVIIRAGYVDSLAQIWKGDSVRFIKFLMKNRLSIGSQSSMASIVVNNVAQLERHPYMKEWQFDILDSAPSHRVRYNRNNFH